MLLPEAARRDRLVSLHKHWRRVMTSAPGDSAFAKCRRILQIHVRVTRYICYLCLPHTPATSDEQWERHLQNRAGRPLGQIEPQGHAHPDLHFDSTRRSSVPDLLCQFSCIQSPHSRLTTCAVSSATMEGPVRRAQETEQSSDSAP